jgi:fucose 4-O-acetylase-like acetyltransferase
MNTTKPGQRSAYWDNLKGLLMLLVVFAHVIYQLQLSSPHIDRTVDYIYIFHMPAFVFISGYFGKSEKSHSLESIVKLIFLYFIFNSIVGFIYGFESLLVPMYSFWYLLALIVWRLTAHHIAKFKEINLILFAVALFAGFYPSIDNTFSAARIIGFYPYYMLGYQLSTQKSEELINKKYSKRAPLGLLLFALTSGAAVAARTTILPMCLNMQSPISPRQTLP